MTFFNELLHRNVLRVAAAYVVAAWLLIQVTETIFPLFGFDDTPARIVVIVLAIGFIPAVIFAWVFEMTPEGLKKEKDVDRTQSITPHTGKKLDRMIMMVLALALGYFAFDKFVLMPQRAAEQLANMEEQKTTEVAQALQQGRTEGLVDSYGDRSIAVLPFVNMSDDASNEFFSDGISEELLNLLAKIPQLRVISRSSAFSYKGKDINLSQVADELNVAHILEGSVRKAGNKVRITAQLIEARSDTHLWSETYDRQLDDIFAIQDEIAATVVAQLKITLLGTAPTVRVTDPEAYALILEARYLQRRMTRESLDSAIALYAQVLDIDPESIEALTGTATVYMNQANFKLRDRQEAVRLAREAVEQALAIDSDDPRVLSRMVALSMWFDDDLSAAARYAQRSLKSDPADGSVLAQAATLSLLLGRTDQAVALQEYLTARDPVNVTRRYNMANYYYYAGRWEEGIKEYRAVLRLQPEDPRPHIFIGSLLVLSGRPEEGMQEILLAPQGATSTERLIALFALDRHQEFEAGLAELPDSTGALELAGVYAWSGDADTAFTLLEKAIQENSPSLKQTFLDPWLITLHNDPRWIPWLASIGKSPDQLAAIEFEVSPP